MQFPKPIGYYSINLPLDVQNQIQSLSIAQLKSLIFDIGYRLVEPSEEFTASELSGLSMTTSDIIENSLSGNDWIYFMQWVLEGLKQVAN